jgi:type IV secretory pathway TrbD component
MNCFFSACSALVIVLIFWKKELQLWIIALKMFIFMARKSGGFEKLKPLKY